MGEMDKTAGTSQEEAQAQRAQDAMDGSPSTISEPFINIFFQCGPVKEAGQNGTQITRVLTLLRDRLEGFQRGPFRCRENALAITKIEESMMWLRYRTDRRIRQGIEGTNQENQENKE